MTEFTELCQECRKAGVDIRVTEIHVPERPLCSGDFNRWMQHLSSNYRAEDVADEAKAEDLLQFRAEELDVGSLARKKPTLKESRPLILVAGVGLIRISLWSILTPSGRTACVQNASAFC